MGEITSAKQGKVTDCMMPSDPQGCEASPKEELYIGCKVIKAIPMTSDEFKKFKGQEFGDGENCPGYKVEYEDGYVSWSPAWTFENAYRKLTSGEKNFLS